MVKKCYISAKHEKRGGGTERAVKIKENKKIITSLGPVFRLNRLPGAKAILK